MLDISRLTATRKFDIFNVDRLKGLPGRRPFKLADSVSGTVTRSPSRRNPDPAAVNYFNNSSGGLKAKVRLKSINPNPAGKLTDEVMF